MPSVAVIGTRGYPSYYGGFETAVRKLAPYLADQGWDVSVYGREGASRSTDRESDPRVKLRVTRGIESRSLSTLSHGLTAAMDARRMRFDAALVMNVANGYWLPLLRSRGIPTAVNVDGIEWEREKWSRLGRSVFKWGARATAKFADELIVDARAIGEHWQEHFGRGGEFIPYGGEDSPAYSLEPGLVHRGYVLAVARFVPENSIPEFLSAAEILCERYQVVLVGSSGYGGELEERVRQLDAKHERFRWLGHLNDDRRLHSLWQHAGVYFHGHSVGGTNPALVQAMTCGAPIVARDTVYSKEVLGDGGVFTQPEPNDIVRAVSGLMDDSVRQEEVSILNRERAAVHYTWRLVCAQYDRVLRSLLPQHKSSSLRMEEQSADADPIS